MSPGGFDRRGTPIAPVIDMLQLVERVRDAERRLAHDIDKPQQRLRLRMQRDRVWFDRELRRRHRRLRQTIPAYVRNGSVLSLLTAPVIYSMFVPFAVLDLWVTCYQFVCFPIYGIARVRRRDYFALDRHRLAYLNGIEKFNCTFCTYANGLLAYVREVAARTEQYWCPIKHARAIRAPHARYRRFLDYGDADGYRRSLTALREALSTDTGRGVEPSASPRAGSALSRRPRRGHAR